MQYFIHKVRYVGIALVGVLLLEMIPFNLLHASGPVRVENVRIEKSATQINILYDLIGDKSEKYTVSVSLRRETVPGFKYSPDNVTGDVGDGVSAGPDKKVVWDYRRDLPQGLTGSDYFVIVDVSTVGTGISPLVWIGGGIAAVAATALLVFGKKSSEEVAPVAVPTFPAEPGRPK